MNKFIRVKGLLGENALTKLQASSVLLFGVGGVGGFIAEALVRTGLGNITVVDGDVVDESNINRQIIASTQTIGLSKVEVIKQRLLSINPNLKIKTVNLFYLPENQGEIDFQGYDYVVDAIDTVSAKLTIIEKAKTHQIKVISCMGTAGKTQPSKLTVGDIYQTKDCPLARVMRRELKKRGIKELKVVFSTEQKKTENSLEQLSSTQRQKPPSTIFVPATAGLIVANEVVNDIINS